MPLVTERFTEPGAVTIDRTLCKSCFQCVTICPGAPLYKHEGRVEIDQSRWFGCIACGHCMMVCPEGAIRVRGRGLSPEDVRELAPPSARAGYESLMNLLRARRATRVFQKREVPRDIVQQILDAASTAPMGVPPSEVGIVVANGFDNVQVLAEDALAEMLRQRWIFSPWMTALIRPFVSRADYLGMKNFLLPVIDTYAEERRKGRDLMFYDAPLAFYFYASGFADPGDPIIAATHAVLAAESLGLGTSFIGLPGYYFKSSRKLRRKYNVPDGIQPGIVVIAGYPAVNWKRSVERHFARVHFT